MAKLVMVFNDTQEILHLFHEILSEEGYEVSLHSYNTFNLDLVKKVKPDLVISDHPPIATLEKQGWQLIQVLRMSRETEHVPVVICTTDIKKAQESEGYLAEKGMLILPKPFNIDELLKAIEELIGKADEPGVGGFNPKVN